MVRTKTGTNIKCVSVFVEIRCPGLMAYLQEPISNAFPFSSKPGLMGPKTRTITDPKSVLSRICPNLLGGSVENRERTDLESVIVRVFGPIRPGFDENGNAFDIGSCKYAPCKERPKCPLLLLLLQVLLLWRSQWRRQLPLAPPARCAYVARSPSDARLASVAT